MGALDLESQATVSPLLVPWELNSGPLEEQKVLLPMEITL